MPPETPGILATNITRHIDYVCSFNGSNIGLVDEVDPSGLKMILDPISTGSTGSKLILGHRVVGFQGSVKIQLRQLNLALYQSMLPWNAAAVPAVLMPPLNTDLYAWSMNLTLHPDDMGTATTEDIIFTHAVPVTLPLPKRGGNKDDVWEIEFNIYPDRPSFNASYGAIAMGMIKGS